MKNKIISVIAVMFIVLAVGGCATQPIPTYDISALNNQIAEYQSKLDKIQLESINQSENKDAEIEELNSKLKKYQDDLAKANTLDNTDWIYPAKVEYKGYRAGVVCVYSIKVHNGDNETRQFHLNTESVVSDDVSFAKVPKNISDWVSYDGYNEYIFSVVGKGTNDISVQFEMPIEGRFYSITDKGYDYKLYNLNAVKNNIMKQFVDSTTLSIQQIKDNKWELDVKTLVDVELLITDKKFQFISVYSEYQPQGNIITRNAIKWVVNMSEFSK